MATNGTIVAHSKGPCTGTIRAMRHTPRSARMTRGFTLIELLVAMAIAAVLAAIAYPSFMAAIYKSRRADGIAAVMRIQQAQERWRSNHSAYTTDASVNGLNVPLVSPDKHYALSISLPAAANGNAYEITATAQGMQAKDTKCQSLTVSMPSTGALVYSSSNGVTSNTGANDPCWAR